MTVVGSVESLWRYPVKSMRGQTIPHAFLGFAGVYGDRQFAFRSRGAPVGFPYLTARDQQQMLLYQARFQTADEMMMPPNLAEAEAISPGATPVYPEPSQVHLEVVAPSGEVFGIDDQILADLLSGGRVNAQGELTLHRSERAMTDCRPISLLSIQTARRLGEEMRTTIDKRRFRANVYLDLAAGDGFAEDTFVGRRLRIGPKAVVAIIERDPRCKMITLDPDTAEANLDVLRTVNRTHENKAGVYAAVLTEGLVHQGDEIRVID